MFEHLKCHIIPGGSEKSNNCHLLFERLLTQIIVWNV